MNHKDLVKQVVATPPLLHLRSVVGALSRHVHALALVVRWLDEALFAEGHDEQGVCPGGLAAPPELQGAAVPRCIQTVLWVIRQLYGAKATCRHHELVRVRVAIPNLDLHAVVEVAALFSIHVPTLLGVRRPSDGGGLPAPDHVVVHGAACMPRPVEAPAAQRQAAQQGQGRERGNEDPPQPRGPAAVAWDEEGPGGRLPDALAFWRLLLHRDLCRVNL
mmetsp:Transcript_104797/g.291864  ORF Transcript_104797/g.291864 Transcript_104797/m.291864 type:complete len:219 (+) Transcript_104797:399-1055(+)